MIKITDADGKATYLAPVAVAKVHESGPASKYRGIYAYVQTFDGNMLEAREPAEMIVQMIEDAARHD